MSIKRKDIEIAEKVVELLLTEQGVVGKPQEWAMTHGLAILELATQIFKIQALP